MTAEQRARAERMIDGHPEDGGGIRPAVMFADHSYPAFSRKQMIEFALAFAAETREEAARVADAEAAKAERFAKNMSGSVALTCERARIDSAKSIAAAIRRGEGGGNG